MSEFGFVRVSLCIPSVRVADVDYNLEEHKRLIVKASDQGARIIAFPELSLTGYSCDDLFHNSFLIEKTITAVASLVHFSKDYKGHLFVIGVPLPHNGSLYNGAIVINEGKIVGYYTKTFPPNYNEFKEEIYFNEAPKGVVFATIDGIGEIPFGNELMFEDPSTGLTIGIEICEDLWSPLTPAQLASLSGAQIVLNLSASNEIIGKANHRNELVRIMSDKLMCAYCFTSAGISESTAETVFGGHSLIYELGTEIGVLPPFSENDLLLGDIDFHLIGMRRIRNTTWKKAVSRTGDFRDPAIFPISVNTFKGTKLIRPLSRYPFLPSVAPFTKISDALKSQAVLNLLEEAFTIQAHALAKRLLRAGTEKLVINLSGGVDSTLAFLVSVEALNLARKNLSDLVAVTLPGPGTTETTLSLVRSLCKEFKVGLREISIEEMIDLETQLIGLKDRGSIVFENLQARLRTQIGFNIANQENGLLVGTGDLSEIALGWMTYNGDHMSSYAVNASIPKTMVQMILHWYSQERASSSQKNVLRKILTIPISPELLPTDGGISQKTEDIIGPYELHDFFLYHFVKNQFSPLKISFLAKIAFKGKFSGKEIDKWLKVFVKRFFQNQFKRSAMPEGPKVTSISLSPRSEWRMKGDILDSWSKYIT